MGLFVCRIEDVEKKNEEGKQGKARIDLSIASSLKDVRIFGHFWCGGRCSGGPGPETDLFGWKCSLALGAKGVGNR